MLTPVLENYLNTPIIFLMMVALGIAVHAFAVSWAASVCTFTSVSYVRSAMIVMAMAIANAMLFSFLQSRGIGANSAEALLAAGVISMIIISIAVQADVVNALLILIFSTLVTAGAAFVFLMVCERFA